MPNSGNNTTKNDKLSQRMAMLGIPAEELTPSVSIAVAALFDKLDNTNRKLRQLQHAIKEVQGSVDIEAGTPIPNRKAFERRLDWALSITRRHGHPVTLLQIDIPNIEEISNTYGDMAAQMAYAHVLQILRTYTRDSDYLAGFNRRSFLIMLFEADEMAAQAKASQMQHHIIHAPLAWNGHGITLDVATGMHRLKTSDNAEQAIDMLDTATYVTKRRQDEQEKALSDLRV